MPGYICLLKFTPEALGKLSEMPQQLREIRSIAEGMGIRTVGIWITMGQYDAFAVTDAPDDQTMAAFVLSVAKKGHATTQTMRALSEEELAQVVGRVT